MINHGPVPTPLDIRWQIRYPERESAIDAFIVTFHDAIDRASSLDDDTKLTPEDRHFSQALRKLMEVQP